jgi:predicted amidohydrolase
MRIALLQGPAGSGDVAENLALLETTARDAAAAGARLLVTPEMFLTGYAIGADAVRRLAEPSDGPSAGEVARIARATGLAVLYGWPELDDGSVYNAATLVDRDGHRLSTYRKAHLYGDVDTSSFRPGNGDFVTVPLDDFRIGLLICYDVEFPETVRSLALAGADLVVVPTALMLPYDVVARTLVPARAYENQLYVAYVNRTGHEADLEYCGLSCLVAPDGSDLVRAGTGEQVVYADLDLAGLRASRVENSHLRDRRPDLYGALVDDGHAPGPQRSSR